MSSNRVHFAVYDAEGRIRRTGVCDAALLTAQAQGDEFVIEHDGSVVDTQHYIADGAVNTYPPKPSDLHIWQGGAWIDPSTLAQAAARLAAAKQQGIDQINRASAAIRRRYVTEIPGQEALYVMKEAEARAWLTTPGAQVADYPLIGAEVGITGTTPDQVAQIYLNLAGVYRLAAAQLETARLGAIGQIEVAETEAVVQAIVAAFQAALEAV